MSVTLTSIDELRRLVADPESITDPYSLREERLDRVDTVDRLLRDTTGRARKADEQRLLDRENEAITLIDRALIAVGRREAEHAARRERRVAESAAARNSSGLFRDTDTSSGSDFGQRLAEAIGEVREGRAQAFVDYDTRAFTEGGNGGYGVNTVMADPVMSLAARSVVMSLPGIRRVNATTGDRMRFPRFNAVTVGATAEATALTAAATDLDAVDVVFQKFSTYETLSTELEEDFSAPALNVLGERMLKDLAARVDSGLIQGTGAADIVGIFSQSGASSTSVAGLPADFDKIDEAIYQLELNDGNPVAWVMHPRSWRILKQIKTGIASDKTTLLADPQNEPRQLRGLPVFTSSAISITSGATSVGSTAAVVDTSQLIVVTRRPARLEVSRDVAFATDMISIRATTRVGLGVIDAAGGISLLTDIRAS
jgi:HK97 family phage major capsid protein